MVTGSRPAVFRGGEFPGHERLGEDDVAGPGDLLCKEPVILGHPRLDEMDVKGDYPGPLSFQVVHQAGMERARPFVGVVSQTQLIG